MIATLIFSRRTVDKNFGESTRCPITIDRIFRNNYRPRNRTKKWTNTKKTLAVRSSDASFRKRESYHRTEDETVLPLENLSLSPSRSTLALSAAETNTITALFPPPMARRI